MSTLKTTTILGVTGVILYASTVMAETPSEPKVTKTEVQNTQVLASAASSDLVPVESEDGQIFYNHFVSEDELYDATVNYETVDTYTFEHNGRIYTNKIVTE